MRTYIQRNTQLTDDITETCRGSVVDIAARYGIGGSEIESRRKQIFRTRPHRLWGPPSFLYNGYRDIPGGKRPDHPPHLALRLKKE
jgi:hypothetical protein